MSDAPLDPTPSLAEAVQHYCFVHGWQNAQCAICSTQKQWMWNDTPGAFAMLYVDYRTRLTWALREVIEHLEHGYDGRALIDLQEKAAPLVGSMRNCLWGEWEKKQITERRVTAAERGGSVWGGRVTDSKEPNGHE